MKDLLDEEEFIEKKSDYNPWRRFGVFYGIAAVIILVYFIYTAITNVEMDDDTLVAVIWGIPILLSFVMVFSKKDNCYLSWKQILMGIQGMMASCFTVLLFISIFIEETNMFTWENLQVIFFVLAMFIGLGLVCFSLLYPILRYKRKRLKQRL